MPAFLGQYNPLLYYIENTKDNELLFTTLNSDICSPKIRYNLKDSGVVYDYEKFMKIIQQTSGNDLNQKGNLHLPFLAIFGRSDGTISLDGANIYPNDVQDALFKSEMAESVKSFYIDVGYTADKSMVFKINVELSENKNISSVNKESVTKLENYIRDYLLKANRDYKESYENNPESLSPRIEFFDSGSGIFLKNKSRIKNIYYIKQ